MTKSLTLITTKRTICINNEKISISQPNQGRQASITYSQVSHGFCQTKRNSLLALIHIESIDEQVQRFHTKMFSYCWQPNELIFRDNQIFLILDIVTLSKSSFIKLNFQLSITIIEKANHPKSLQTVSFPRNWKLPLFPSLFKSNMSMCRRRCDRPFGFL